MSWLLLILLAAAVGISFSAAARNTHKVSGMICLLLLVTAAGLFSARASIDLTLSVTAKALDTAVSSADIDSGSDLTLSAVPVIPGLAGSIIRAVLGLPLIIIALVQIIRGRFRKDPDMGEAAAHRRRLGITSAVLMTVTFIASAVLFFSHANELIGLGIIIGALTLILLLLSLICPLFLLLVLALAGVGLIAAVKLLSTPIMLYFVSSAAYLLSAACAVGICVSAMRLTSVKKFKYIPLILLSLIPAANCAVYRLIPSIIKKNSVPNGMI